ncbi:MAG TPA: hypothetical protein PKY77_08855 [Phycisphaerae bacterium]|nr:hypothetical protein [Phycisphaerae bacterium]HRY67284.1 hypothetical protein [Phycisphaerae bacterium]HSA26346.1 hypothetical protein [Phycisphaerae bacterium]
MLNKTTITTRCPTCRGTYTVPPTAVGHRATCSKCKSVFRVSEYNPHPTEDDILRWLNEGMEEYEFSRDDRMDEGSAPEAAKDKATPIPRNTTPLAQAS